MPTSGSYLRCGNTPKDFEIIFTTLGCEKSICPTGECPRRPTGRSSSNSGQCRCRRWMGEGTKEGEFSIYCRASSAINLQPAQIYSFYNILLLTLHDRLDDLQLRASSSKFRSGCL